LSDAAPKKEQRRKFQAIRGTRDLLPPDTQLWNHVEETAHSVFGTFGFGEIRPPIFEPTELFARAVGGETDIVSKEMYTFIDRSEKLGIEPKIGKFGEYIERIKSLMASGEIPDNDMNRLAIRRVEENWKKYQAIEPGQAVDAEILENLYQMVTYSEAMQLGTQLSLRPEATASVCRAYIEHGMQSLPQPVKLYYIGPMFRRERPQKGRYRQFYQIGAEVLDVSRPDPGKDALKELSKDAAIDADVIEMLMAFFKQVGLESPVLNINSIGHVADNCRRAYVEILRTHLMAVKDQLGEDSQRRIETNPLRVFDSKLEFEQPIIEQLPHISGSLCRECEQHYSALKQQLNMRQVKYEENWRLVRGLDYYMRTTFEITAQGLGSQNAVCGGGRYDGLVELLGGPPTKGIGFAIGEDRLIMSLQDQRLQLPDRRYTRPSIYIGWMGDAGHSLALSTASGLRVEGFRVEVPTVEQKANKALNQAEKLGLRYVVILGENEVSTQEYTVKTLSTGTQEKVHKDDLLKYVNGQFV
jgi:histidyl-tRNA synthetase